MGYRPPPPPLVEQDAAVWLRCAYCNRVPWPGDRQCQGCGAPVPPIVRAWSIGDEREMEAREWDALANTDSTGAK